METDLKELLIDLLQERVPKFISKKYKKAEYVKKKARKEENLDI